MREDLESADDDDFAGNPIGGLVFSNAFGGQYAQMHEWTVSLHTLSTLPPFHTLRAQLYSARGDAGVFA